MNKPTEEPNVIRMRKALDALIYEITHLSPERNDGSHQCTISAATLKYARDAYHDR